MKERTYPWRPRSRTKHLGESSNCGIQASFGRAREPTCCTLLPAKAGSRLLSCGRDSISRKFPIEYGKSTGSNSMEFSDDQSFGIKFQGLIVPRMGPWRTLFLREFVVLTDCASRKSQTI